MGTTQSCTNQAIHDNYLEVKSSIASRFLASQITLSSSMSTTSSQPFSNFEASEFSHSTQNNITIPPIKVNSSLSLFLNANNRSFSLENNNLTCSFQKNSNCISSIPHKDPYQSTSKGSISRTNTTSASPNIPNSFINYNENLKSIFGNPKNHKPFLEKKVLDHLIPMLYGIDMLQCMLCCPHWFMTILNWVEDLFEPVIQSLKAKYCNFFEIQASTIKFQPIYTTHKSIRADWTIFAKVLPNCAPYLNFLNFSYSYSQHSQKRITIKSYLNALKTLDKNKKPSAQALNSFFKAYSPIAPGDLSSGHILVPTKSSFCEITNSKMQASYKASHAFLVHSKGSVRHIWVHKNSSNIYGDELQVAMLSNIQTVCVDDILEISLPLFNAFAIVDVSCFKWEPLIQKPINSSILCPVEKDINYWYNYNEFRYFTPLKIKMTEDFSPSFQHISTEYTGCDIVIKRSVYKAIQEGLVTESALRIWGNVWEIVPANQPIVVPLPRLDLEHDRILSVQIRVGDNITYYLSQGGIPI